MSNNKKVNGSEAVVRRHLQDKGYDVLRSDFTSEPGVPDFKCINFKTNERFYVEVKSEKHDLSEIQKITIKKLISDGFLVKLAVVHKYRIDFYKLDEKMHRTLLENVDIPHTEYFFKKCSYCDYQWEARIEHPKSCPKCKHRFDFLGDIRKISDVKEEK
jgi:Holliday junction resolvase